MKSSELVGQSWKRCYFPNFIDILREYPDKKTLDIMIGIDEAGRGPVLGSLIYSACFWPEQEDPIYRKLGFNDSKQVNENDRKKLLEKLLQQSHIGYVMDEITSQEISKNMLKQHPISLNEISYQSVVKLLTQIHRNLHQQSDDQNIILRITNIYIDTVGDPEYYKNRLKQGLGNEFDGNFIIEKKADATYPIVSAASILAKQSRDQLLKDWNDFDEDKLFFSRDYGSGYPGDDICVQWMKANIHPVFGYPSIVRFSWSTTREALQVGNAAKVKWECDDDDEATVFGGSAITSFFGAAGEKRPKRCSYFTSKKMKHILPHELSDLF